MVAHLAMVPLVMAYLAVAVGDGADAGRAHPGFVNAPANPEHEAYYDLHDDTQHHGTQPRDTQHHGHGAAPQNKLQVWTCGHE